MKILPAIDLQDGCVVQLVGGVRGTQQITLEDPVAVAQAWERKGARSLHVVDLDAAFGDGSNADLVRSILAATRLDVQVGGGVRTTEQADQLLSWGASRVVVGTRALADRAWLQGLASTFPNRVLVAVDARAGRTVTDGWTKGGKDRPEEVAASLARLPLAGIATTCVDVEGRQQGIDRPFAQRMIEATTLPVTISGGVTTLDDVRFLRDAKAHAAIIGLSLYTGRLDLAQAQGIAEKKP